MNNAIEIRGLIKKYPAFALGPLDLTVPRGAIYGLIGPNGAGKTTAIDMIFGMGRNDAGQIRVLGLDHRADEVAKTARRLRQPRFEFSSLGPRRQGDPFRARIFSRLGQCLLRRTDESVSSRCQ